MSLEPWEEIYYAPACLFFKRVHAPKSSLAVCKFSSLNIYVFFHALRAMHMQLRGGTFSADF